MKVGETCESVIGLSCSQSREQTLAELFDLHQPRLMKMIQIRLDPRLQRRVDPNDVLQETFLVVQRKYADYCATPKLPFYLWLRLETIQKLIDVHRMHLGAQIRDVSQEISLHQGGLRSVESVTLAEHLLGRLTSASHVAMRAEAKLIVQDALNRMEAHDREMLILRHFEELTNVEAARTLEISPTAACNRYIRAIKRLRRALAGLPDFLETSRW